MNSVSVMVPSLELGSPRRARALPARDRATDARPRRDDRRHRPQPGAARVGAARPSPRRGGRQPPRRGRRRRPQHRHRGRAGGRSSPSSTTTPRRSRPGSSDLASCFDDPGVVGVTGELLPRWTGTEPDWFPPEFYWVFGCSYTGLPTELAPVRNPIGANMAVRGRDAAGDRRLPGQGVAPREIRYRGVVSAGGHALEDTELGIRIRQRWPRVELAVPARGNGASHGHRGAGDPRLLHPPQLRGGRRQGAAGQDDRRRGGPQLRAPLRLGRPAARRGAGLCADLLRRRPPGRAPRRWRSSSGCCPAGSASWPGVLARVWQRRR